MSMDVNLEDVNKWASIFSAIGTSTRLAILLILHASMYTRAGQPKPQCLTFTEIKNVLGIPSESTLSYHLQKLLEAELVEKQAAKDENGRVFPLYSVSQKWIDFVKDTGLERTFHEYVKKWQES